MHLLGERNSGTNFAEALLRASLLPCYGSPHPVYPFAKHVPLVGFKHMFVEPGVPTAASITEAARWRGSSSLWIMVVRAPGDCVLFIHSRWMQRKHNSSKSAVMC